MHLATPKLTGENLVSLPFHSTVRYAIVNIFRVLAIISRNGRLVIMSQYDNRMKQYSLI